MNTRAARLYVSPRTRALTPDEQETRRLAYALKDSGKTPEIESARAICAREMAASITGPCNLIPVPSRTGDTTANRLLCQAIGRQVQGGAYVCDILRRRRPVDGQCERHKRGQGSISIGEHGIYRQKGKFLRCIGSFFVDNVTTSGNTLEACAIAFPGGEGLVFADAWRGRQWNKND